MLFLNGNFNKHNNVDPEDAEYGLNSAVDLTIKKHGVRSKEALEAIELADAVKVTAEKSNDQYAAEILTQVKTYIEDNLVPS